MIVLFVSSWNRGDINIVIKSQGKSLKNSGLHICYFGVEGKGLKGYLLNILRLRKYIKNINPDIIHAHYSLSAFAASLTMTRNPLIVSLMGSDIQAGKIYKLIIWFFKHTLWDACILKSKAMQQIIGIRKTIVIPNGVDLLLFSPIKKNGLKKLFTFSEDKETILFLADPTRESKNFRLAKQAFHLLDPKKSELIVRYNIPHKDIPMILNAADVMLLTSKWEGSPNVVKEAMACNCPVVATGVGDVAWLFGDEEGYFLTDFRPEDVAEKINCALEYAKEKGRTIGRDRIIELCLDDESIAKRLTSVYQSVLR